MSRTEDPEQRNLPPLRCHYPRAYGVLFTFIFISVLFSPSDAQWRIRKQGSVSNASGLNNLFLPPWFFALPLSPQKRRIGCPDLRASGPHGPARAASRRISELLHLSAIHDPPLLLTDDRHPGRLVISPLWGISIHSQPRQLRLPSISSFNHRIDVPMLHVVPRTRTGPYGGAFEGTRPHRAPRTSVVRFGAAGWPRYPINLAVEFWPPPHLLRLCLFPVPRGSRKSWS